MGAVVRRELRLLEKTLTFLRQTFRFPSRYVQTQGTNTDARCKPEQRRRLKRDNTNNGVTRAARPTIRSVKSPTDGPRCCDRRRLIISTELRRDRRLFGVVLQRETRRFLVFLFVVFVCGPTNQTTFVTRHKERVVLKPISRPAPPYETALNIARLLVHEIDRHDCTVTSLYHVPVSLSITTIAWSCRIRPFG